MGFMNWFSRKTPLMLALDRGMKPGVELADELNGLREYSIESAADGNALCDALERVLANKDSVGGKSAIHSLIGLFQTLAGAECPAFAVVAERGLPSLVALVHAVLDGSVRMESDNVLFALKILAMYGSPEGTDAVVRAARQPLRPDAYMWSVILQPYSAGHPDAERLMEALSDPLPPDFLAVSLLDCANAGRLSGAAWPHPFSSAAGAKRLEQWLTDRDEDLFSYAVSATCSLPWIDIDARDSLLALAFDHPSVDVQLESAWVAAKLGRDAGVRWLARSCLDVNVADRARRYLTELGREADIPFEADDPAFRAQAEFARWLAHPNELGRAPDELTIVDHRVLDWPPERQPIPLWLLKYRVADETGLANDDVGVGLVGSVTFCLFSYKLEQRPPEDAYAIHCYWELSSGGLIAEAKVPDGSTEFDSMLRQCKVDGLANVRIRCVAELSPELRYPQHIVAMAAAMRHGEPGWIVIDGARSRWYAAAEMPADAFETTVLMLHIGRVLLGFDIEPDRRRFLAAPIPSRSPEQIVAAYERLLDQARSDSRQCVKLLGGHGVLGSAFPDYVAALAEHRSRSNAICVCTAYESILSIVTNADASHQTKLLDSFAPLGRNFETYVAALIELNRHSEVPALIERFRPHWDHNLGYGLLGAAAFKSGHDPLAESFLVKLRHSLKDWFRAEEIGSLAEIWKRQGREDDAHALLVDALQGLLAQSRTATGSDRNLFEKWYQTRRSTYLQLFPDRGESELRRRGIPTSTFSGS